MELAHGGRRSSNDARGSYGGGSRGGGGGRDGGDRGRGPSRRSEYRGTCMIILGLISMLEVIGEISNLFFFFFPLYSCCVRFAFFCFMARP